MFTSTPRIFPLLLGILVLAACSATSQAEQTRTPASTSSDLEVARETLITYFNDLYAGNYDRAADRYGGDLNMLAEWNDDVDSSSPSELLAAACSRQLQCLPVRQIIYASQTGEGTFTFKLEFSNPDDTLFVLGPCCGANETDMPPVSQFDCAVEKSISGNYNVMCLPVFVP